MGGGRGQFQEAKIEMANPVYGLGSTNQPKMPFRTITFFNAGAYQDAIAELVKPLANTIVVDAAHNKVVTAFDDRAGDLTKIQATLKNHLATLADATRKHLSAYFEATKYKPAIVEEKDHNIVWATLGDALFPNTKEFSLAKYKELWGKKDFNEALIYLRSRDDETVTDDDLTAILRLLCRSVSQDTNARHFVLPLMYILPGKYEGPNILHPMRQAFLMEEAECVGDDL